MLSLPIRPGYQHSMRIHGRILESLHSGCCARERDYLDQRTGLGRAITCDGATSPGQKLIAFLCLNRMKGVVLLSMVDYDMRLEDSTKEDTPYNTAELLNAAARVGHVVLMHVPHYCYHVTHS